MGFFTPDPEPSNSTFGSIDPSLFNAPIDWSALPFGLASPMNLAPVPFRNPAQPQHNPYLRLVANGPPCEGAYCQSGGTYGTTGMYVVDGKNVCRDCAVKILGIGNLPSTLQTQRLAPYLPD